MRPAEGVGQSGFLHRTTGCRYMNERSPVEQPFWPKRARERKFRKWLGAVLGTVCSFEKKSAAVGIETTSPGGEIPRGAGENAASG
jgi:hypothetical protein